MTTSVAEMMVRSECHRRCAEINRPDADFRHRLSLLADSTGSKRNEEAGGEKAEGES